MDHFSLSNNYEVKDAGSNNIVVLVSGSREYKRILSRAFPEHFLSRTFDDRYMRFDWGTYIYSVSSEMKQEVNLLLDTCSRHIFLDDDLTECFALDYHTLLAPSGGYPRTDIGNLIYRAKPYNRKPTKGHVEAAQELAQKMLMFIENHPTYRRCEVVIAAPPSRPNKPFDLPKQLAQHILDACDTMVNGISWIEKIRKTRAMKDCRTIPEKIDNVRGAFKVTEDANLAGKIILLVDDIYHSGFTMNEVGSVLFDDGAKAVLGKKKKKTGRDI